MTRIPSWVRGATTLLALAAALVGWSMVHLQDRWLDGLEGELAEARRQGATPANETSTSLGGNATVGESAPGSAAVSNQAWADLEQLRSELETSETVREVLHQTVLQSEAELRRLRTKLDQVAQAPNDSGREFRTVTRTRMRAGPTTEAEEVAVIAQGASLQVIGTVEDGTWHEVRVVGYAFHELLEPSQGD